jgi:hypothetical protein
MTREELDQIIALLQEIATNTRSDVTQFLPGEGWKIQQYVGNLPGKDTNTLQPGESSTIVNEDDEQGELEFVSLTTDNPYVQFTVELKAPNNTWQNVTASFFLLAQWQATLPNAVLPYLGRYDTTNNFFSLKWTPFPRPPYRGARGSIQNLPTTQAVVPGVGFVNTAVPNVTAHVYELTVVRRVFA